MQNLEIADTGAQDTQLRLKNQQSSQLRAMKELQLKHEQSIQMLDLIQQENQNLKEEN